jgi:hypothetical protein
MTHYEIDGLDAADTLAHVNEADGRVTVYQVLCREWRATASGRRRWNWLKPVSPAGEPVWEPDSRLLGWCWEAAARTALRVRVYDLEDRLRAAREQLRAFERLEEQLQATPPGGAMTDAELGRRLLGRPNQCPGCDGTDLEAGRPRLADHEDWLECAVECENCGATWTEEYRLAGGRNFQPKGTPCAG